MECPLCFSGKFSLVYDQKKTAFPGIARCSTCSHVFTIPVNPAGISSSYTEGAYQLIENRRSLWDKILTWEYSRIVQKINSFKKNRSWLLDFGSGKGKFASLAQCSGWNVKCVETAEKRAEYAKVVYGLDVNTDSYSTGRIFDNLFDVLTLLHVLEHLQSPTSLLHELIGNNLKENALIVIEVPNINSWQARIAGRYWMHWDLPRHLSHFSTARLEQFTATLGLTTLSTSHFSFHLGVLGMTDSILKKLGYRSNIIYELKTRRNKLILLAIIFLLPLSFLAETIASLAGKGGIVRKYLTRKK